MSIRSISTRKILRSSPAVCSCVLPSRRSFQSSSMTLSHENPLVRDQFCIISLDSHAERILGTAHVERAAHDAENVERIADQTKDSRREKGARRFEWERRRRQELDRRYVLALSPPLAFEIEK